MKSIKSKSIFSILLILLLVVSITIPSLAQTQSNLTTASDTAEPTESFELVASKAQKIARVTGRTLEGETIPNPSNTPENYGLTATDLGIVWDATTDPEHKKVMVAFGDSYDDGWGGFGGGGTGWRGNLLALSEDTDLTDGMTFSTMIADEETPNYAKEIIYSAHNTSGSSDFTAIPTAGVTVGDRHFIHYMQIRNWGANGRWNTNFSEIAYSDDEGQNWTKSGIKWGADSKFAQAAFLNDSVNVYMFGTPAGRFDAAYLARVKPENMLVKEEYEYWNGSEWIKNNEAAAVPVIEAPVSELSVAYNSKYKKYIMTYLNENRYALVMRSSDSLTGGWSDEVEIATGAEFPGLYGAFIHPWTNDGDDLYFVMSEWGPYNTVLMHSTLSKGTPVSNLIQDPSFEQQTTNRISPPWVIEGNKNGGVDRGAKTSRAGTNNVYLRDTTGWNAFTQDIAVQPNTVYRLTGYVKTSQNNANGYFGVRGSAGDILKEVKFGRHDNYEKLTVQFNSGNNTTVRVFTGMHSGGDTWIQADDYMLVPVDQTAPEITLKGEAEIELKLGDSFTDPGATAIDNLDGDLTSKIQVSGKVNTDIVGTYSLKYNVTDSDGNKAAEVTRTVKVTGEEYTVSNAVFSGSDGGELKYLPTKGIVMASADIRNNSSEEKTVTLVFALYNKKGEMENLSGITQSIPSGGVEKISGGFKMPGNNSGYTLEVFVADSLIDLNKLSNVAKLGQKK
ncbi:DUF4185 domain-containing protein [Robertmurraya kyonggiensis]|uniref:DUF4185 domain-containing protein n=1 Tax=Robertmurraya kyonggiensis TaxID=1037680 RepID=A0A4U1CZS3_9BACI|nr:DUF4185 domain-containing protein [Robertmurraya kyonggiensis]TKC15412.1 DUF4185 domain-containing protein [Robertmurraya kyonggiensis]